MAAAPHHYFVSGYFPSLHPTVYIALEAASLAVSNRIKELVTMPKDGSGDGAMTTIAVGSVGFPISEEDIEQAARLVAEEILSSVLIDGKTYAYTARAALIVPNADLLTGAMQTDGQLKIVTQLVG